jgi:hypothetical protein
MNGDEWNEKYGPSWNGKPKHAPMEFAGRVSVGSTREWLAQEFARRGYTKGAEIGVADGRNSLTLCKANPGLHLYCVDPWEPYKGNTRGGPAEQHNGNLALARERLKGYHVEFVQDYSHNVAMRTIGSMYLDFVYLDGNHAFDYVMEDLILWSQVVRSGGMVAGHDFYHFRGAGVVEAVEIYTRMHGIIPMITDEREPSFFWVKP